MPDCDTKRHKVTQSENKVTQSEHTSDVFPASHSHVARVRAGPGPRARQHRPPPPAARGAAPRSATPAGPDRAPPSLAPAAPVASRAANTALISRSAAQANVAQVH
eukprot:1184974-Prorocentrum_minimum.AAC.1